MPEVFFLLFVFLKPFYILPSGSIGIADISMTACVAVLFFQLVRKKEWLSTLKQDWLLYLFLGLAVTINGIHAVLNKNYEFIRYSVFWIYNVAAIWSFRQLGQLYGHSFFKKLNAVVKLNIVIQFLLLLSGKGRIFYEYWGGTRYMGTFNDPNQLAFFLFMMILLAYLYTCQYGDRTYIVFYALAMPVILSSKSTGVLLGVMVFTALAIIWKGYQIGERFQFSRRTWIFLGVGCGLVFGGFLVWIWPPENFDIQQMDYNMITRIQEKIWKTVYGGGSGLLLDRGMDKLLYYPQYLLYGAGEGGFDRFPLASQINEIHSSLFSIWFCYGTVPTILLLVWLGQNLRKLRICQWCAAIGLLIESFLLVNYRQPMFWMILLYAGICRDCEKAERDYEARNICQMK